MKRNVFVSAFAIALIFLVSASAEAQRGGGKGGGTKKKDTPGATNDSGAEAPNREKELALAKETDRHGNTLEELEEELKAATEKKDKAEIARLKKAIEEEKKLHAENVKKIEKAHPPKPKAPESRPAKPGEKTPEKPARP